MLITLGAVSVQAAPAAPAYEARLAGSAVYSDPGFQDFVETSYGYLSPRSSLTLRDAAAAPAPVKPAVKAPKYVFVSIMVKRGNYAGFLSRLGASAGFKMSGERVCRYKNAKTTCLLGWVRADRLCQVRKSPMVTKVAVEKAAL